MKHRKTLGIILIIALTGLKEKDTTTIPFVNSNSLPIIEAKINQQSAYFLIDSGLDITLLHFGDQKKYNFKQTSRDSKQLTGFGGRSQQARSATEVELQFGTLQVTEGIYVCDIATVIENLQRRTGIAISGIVGSHTMLQHDFEIDYGNEMVVIKSANQ